MTTVYVGRVTLKGITTVAFEVSIQGKGRRRGWKALRCSGRFECWEPGVFATPADAMAWGSNLNRHVVWSKEMR